MLMVPAIIIIIRIQPWLQQVNLLQAVKVLAGIITGIHLTVQIPSHMTHQKQRLLQAKPMEGTGTIMACRQKEVFWLIIPTGALPF
jgi:hypothetical protein